VTKELASLMSKCMIVFGTTSFIDLLMIVRYDATSDRMISTCRSRTGSDLAMSSRLYKQKFDFSENTSKTFLLRVNNKKKEHWHKEEKYIVGLRRRLSSAAFCHIKDVRCGTNLQQLWTTLWGKKLHRCSFCNNLIKLRSSMPIFASSYLNVFVTKRCKNFTFDDPSIFTAQIQ